MANDFVKQVDDWLDKLCYPDTADDAYQALADLAKDDDQDDDDTQGDDHET